MNRFILILIFSLTFIYGCPNKDCGVDLVNYYTPRYLAIGDSIMENNHRLCLSISDYLGESINNFVLNEAIGGTLIYGAYNQYMGTDQNFDVVIISSGANNIRKVTWFRQYKLDPEGAILDLKNKMIDLLSVIDSQVILCGYYEMGGAYSNRMQAVFDLNDAYEDIAFDNPDVTFFPAENYISLESCPDCYKNDSVHPTPLASQLLGQALVNYLP